MTKQEVLAAIKALRNKINDEADCGPNAEGWEGEVTEALDCTGDLIEFPKGTMNAAEEPGMRTHKQSVAVSLKRIANVAELFAMSLLTDHAKQDADMADWAKRHGFGDLWPGKGK